MSAIFDPLDQFTIVVYEFFPLTAWNFVFTVLCVNSLIFVITNFLLYMLLAIFSFFFFFGLSIKDNNFIPATGWEHITETAYFSLYTIIEEQLYYDRFFAILFSVFFFVLFSNFVGLIPYGFTTTSFIIKTFMLGFSFFVAITISGLWIHGPKFFKLFLPKNVPSALLPFLIFIEIVSYLSRPVSLSVRLFANMMSGHSLLNILASFSLTLSKKSLVFGFVPFLLVLIITFLEVGIAFLQAYVFLVLLCIYMHDAFNPDH